MTKKEGIGAGIVGMGAYVPEEVRTNDWWPDSFLEEHGKRMKEDVTTTGEQVAETVPQDVDPEVVRHAGPLRGAPFRGSRERRVIAEGQQASDLEAAAVRSAADDAGIELHDIDLLAVYSMLPDVPAPTNHALVAEKLGLRKDTTCLGIDTTCASFVTQLAVVSRLVASGEYRHEAIVQSAVMSRITDYRLPSSVSTGDGAVAAILAEVGPGQGYITDYHETHGDLHGGIRLVPTDHVDVPWHRGDLHESSLTAQFVDQRANHVMGTRPARFCRAACERVLERAGYAREEVDFFITSQPTAWFGRACCDALGIDPGRTLDTFETYAHLMAASAAVNLWTAHRQGRIDRGDLVLVYSPGAGFIQAAVLLRWSLPARR
jgi:3-oxoacyl-[acyl-carrier-protein] synthase-3